jgi:putative colanic acid biosynthesis glycosyltransferase
MNAPRLSIVTITKDDPAGLGRTIDSTAAWRSLSAVEQIVIFAGAAPRVPVGAGLTVHPQNGTGIAAAFNEGLAMARGEWVWFVNGGDAVHEALDPAWLLALLANSRADLVVGGIHYDGDASPRPVPPLRQQWPLLECWLPHPATLVRKQTLLQATGFNADYTIAMDYDLWFRLLNGGATVDVISIPLARFDPTGLSQRADYRKVVCREESKVILRNWRSLLGAPLCLFGRVIHRLLWSVRHCKNGSQQPQAHGQQ